MYHNDKECHQALVQLMDALCTWEREAGRRSTLILIPKEQDEPLLIVQDGKPLPSTLEANIRDIFKLAINEREGITEE